MGQASARHGPADRERPVEACLLTGRVPAGSVDALIEAGLGGYALGLLGAEGASGGAPLGAHELDRLKKAYLRRRVRHASARQVVAELVAAWRERGIETLLLKGFYLAEHVYPDPAWRQYGDVDLAIRSRGAGEAALAEAAADVASAAGWRVVWRYGEPERVDSLHGSAYDGHELMCVYHDKAALALDVHRRLVHSNVERPLSTAKLSAITRAVWDGAGPADLCGVRVLVPSPVDAALVGVITARSWSGDALAIRPSDYLDLKHLFAKGNITREDVLTRARQLKVARTAAYFLSRCDPEAGAIRLRPPSAAGLFLYDLWIAPERSHRSLERLWSNMRNAPSDVLTITKELPGVTRQVARFRSRGRPSWVEAEPEGDKPLSRTTWRRTLFGVRRALQLNGIWPKDQPELTLACVHSSVVSRGYALDVRSEGDRIWFEHGGRVLDLGVLAVREPSETRQRGWRVPQATHAWVEPPA